MTREDFEVIEAKLMKEIVNRRALGGYNADAATLEFLASTIYEISRHISAKLPRKKTEDDKD